MELFVLLLLLCLCPSTRGHQGHQDSGGIAVTDFHDPKVTQDEAHLKEHLKDQINTNRQMTPQEMEFHYFRLHDTNNDTKLDGLEILSALSHMVPMSKVNNQEKIGKTEEQIQLMEIARSEKAIKYFTDIIDKVLIQDDHDRDGYVSYPEYIRGRRRDMENYQREMVMQQKNMQAQQFQQMQQWQAFQQWQQQQQMAGGQNPPPGGAAQSPPGVPSPPNTPTQEQMKQFEEFQKFQQQPQDVQKFTQTQKQ
ncbi:multiple coagulation factor deficiency protein 2 homolog [Pecten maximus]|uniref:multiple coagulation factor deficiency protein 2 homolog n=1 Tax=Pecten maximus TaxID=6579 RepID=UPI001458B55C|nr:multiple coagulation factor deficiency protein 2 homolog [Pecten maximus]